MALEIERKFLLLNDDWRADVAPPQVIRQGYLLMEEKSSVRIRTSKTGYIERAYITIKSGIGIVRTEHEVSIDYSEAQKLLKEVAKTSVILEKERYKIASGRHVIEVDVFGGANQGLVVAEVELGAADEVFLRPAWLGVEVSHDKRYYNINLVTHPFRDWIREVTKHGRKLG